MMIDAADKRRGWTPRRVLRWVGTAAIGIAFLMALFGAYRVGSKVSTRVFYVYWTVFFFFLMSAIALAMFDALVTIARFRKEHKELQKTARHTLTGGKGNAQQG
ncbi:MAG: hypothetical protein ACE5FJ_12125 [Gemmatimonadales bacterium]